MKEDQTVINGTDFTMSPPVIDRPSSPERIGFEPERKGFEPERKGYEKAPSQLEPLFPKTETEAYRSDWHGIQGDFVDDPKRAVEQADRLVATLIQRLESQFANERKGLEEGWSKNGDASTEDLRLAFRKYRAFFDRLLSL